MATVKENGLRLAITSIAGLWQSVPALGQLLVVVMAVDLLFRLANAIRERRVSPKMVAETISRKVAALILVGLAGLIQHYAAINLGVDLIQAAAAFYIFGELVSVAKQAVLLGVLVPPQFKSIIGYFEGFSGGKERKEDGDAPTLP